MFISDEQWEVLGPLLERPRKSQYGRPRAGEREVFEAILFVLHTGIQWKHLPRTFPPKSTVHDYLKAWSQSDAFRRIFAAIISQLIEEGQSLDSLIGQLSGENQFLEWSRPRH